MTTLQTIGIWIIVALIILAVTKILNFFNISTAEYSVYLIFYLFLVVSYFVLPDISTMGGGE